MGTRDQSTERREELLRWAASLGAVTAEALAARAHGERQASARGRLAAAERAGHMRSWAPLRGHPPLYTVTGSGLRAAGIAGLASVRVSAAGATHAAAVAGAAARMERAYPGHAVLGEPAISSAARRGDRALGGLCPVLTGRAGPHTHRPDLALVPAAPRGALPIAVEIELSAKSRARLDAICRAWARHRGVAGVIYVTATGAVHRAVLDAIERVDARERIVILTA